MDNKEYLDRIRNIEVYFQRQKVEDFVRFIGS